MDLVIVAATYIAGLVGLGIVILVVWDKVGKMLWSRRNPPEKIAAERRAIEQRTISPDWEYYEQHLCRPAPLALKTAYSDHALVLATDLVFPYPEEENEGEENSGWFVRFNPLDQKTFEFARQWGYDVLPFCSDMFGSPIYIEPGPRQSNTVFIRHHDGDDIEELAPDVESFLRMVRRREPRT